MTAYPRLLVSSLALLLAACASAPRATVETTTFAPSLGLDMSEMTRLPSGVYYRDLLVGSGRRAEIGDRVALYYMGFLPNGREIDAQREPEPPITFRIGAGDVIRGWELGIEGMRVGGQRQIIVPAELAYGRRGAGPIPPHSAVVFALQLVGVD